MGEEPSHIGEQSLPDNSTKLALGSFVSLLKTDRDGALRKLDELLGDQATAATNEAEGSLSDQVSGGNPEADPDIQNEPPTLEPDIEVASPVPELDVELHGPAKDLPAAPPPPMPPADELARARRPQAQKVESDELRLREGWDDDGGDVKAESRDLGIDGVRDMVIDTAKVRREAEELKRREGLEGTRRTIESASDTPSDVGATRIIPDFNAPTEEPRTINIKQPRGSFTRTASKILGRGIELNEQEREFYTGKIKELFYTADGEIKITRLPNNTKRNLAQRIEEHSKSGDDVFMLCIIGGEFQLRKVESVYERNDLWKNPRNRLDRLWCTTRLAENQQVVKRYPYRISTVAEAVFVVNKQ